MPSYRVRTATQKLTDEQARAVRLSMDTSASLATRFGVSAGLIEQIRAGRTYGLRTPAERAAQERRRQRETGTLTIGQQLLIIGPLFTSGGLVDQDRQEAKDAAWECRHGRLAHDPAPACGCWAQEITKDQPQPGGIPDGSSNGHQSRLGRFAAQAAAVPGRVADDRPVPADREGERAAC